MTRTPGMFDKEILKTIFCLNKEQDRQCTHNVTMARVSSTIVEVEKHKYYIFCVYVFVALVIHHRMRVRLAVIYPALQCFIALSHKRHDF